MPKFRMHVCQRNIYQTAQWRHHTYNTYTRGRVFCTVEMLYEDQGISLLGENVEMLCFLNLKYACWTEITIVYYLEFMGWNMSHPDDIFFSKSMNTGNIGSECWYLLGSNRRSERCEWMVSIRRYDFQLRWEMGDQWTGIFQQSARDWLPNEGPNRSGSECTFSEACLFESVIARFDATGKSK